MARGAVPTCRPPRSPTTRQRVKPRAPSARRWCRPRPSRRSNRRRLAQNPLSRLILRHPDTTIVASVLIREPGLHSVACRDLVTPAGTARRVLVQNAFLTDADKRAPQGGENGAHENVNWIV